MFVLSNVPYEKSFLSFFGGGGSGINGHYVILPAEDQLRVSWISSYTLMAKYLLEYIRATGSGPKIW